MKLVKPYVDENKQVIFVELEDELMHDFVNGFLFAQVVSLLVLGPLYLFL